MENKEHILKLLMICLQETRAGEDITGMNILTASNNSEWVQIWFKTGFHSDVNVTADSGLAMIHSVVEALIDE